MAALDPIAKTAWYCCGVRAADARSARPICGDMLAERFMTEEGRAIFAPFATQFGPNASNATRHRMIDDLLRERLAADPARPVLLLGAGFDTRAFRLAGGRWMELDQPALVALKEQVLPAASAPNPLRRHAIDFAHDRLADALASWAGTRDALVVMEGVSMYLSTAQLHDTARALHALLPRHTLVCDLLTATFLRRYGGPLRQRIEALGGAFAPAHDDPAAWVQAQGYRQRSVASITALTPGPFGRRAPGWLLDTLLRPVRDGYRLHVFEAVAGT